MLRIPGTHRIFQRKRLLAASSLLLLLAIVSVAQSGRRPPRPPQSPANFPQTNDDSTERVPKPRELTHRVTLLVGKQPTSKHLLSEDAIFSNLVKQLREFTNVTVTSLGDLKRDAAVRRAKSEAEAIVVLVQFDIDSFQNGTIIVNSPDLDVRVVALAPGSGKEAFKGKVYYKAVGGPMMKKDNGPNGTPIKITTEAVGIEAAEQVRDWLFVEDGKKKLPVLVPFSDAVSTKRPLLLGA
jgi:hypothetical protein